jgi:uncharacterized protein YjbI with pentapeptide repeats
MANQQHLNVLRQGVATWNRWRTETFEQWQRGVQLEDPAETLIDLSGADLSGVNLRGALLYHVDLSGANLHGADLRQVNCDSTNFCDADLSAVNLSQAYLPGINLFGAKLNGANLSEADLNWTILKKVDFRGVDLTGAKLIGTDLRYADLSQSNLSGADLSFSYISRANLSGACLTGCRVHAISCYDTQLEKTIQSDLILSLPWEVTITVDTLGLAQFIFLLLNNPGLRDMIDGITSKAVLIIGYFAAERKMVAEALCEALRNRNYVPITINVDKPADQDTMKMISILASIVRFVLADLTEAESTVPAFPFILPDFPSIPVQPLLQISKHETPMLSNISTSPWILPLAQYQDPPHLMRLLSEYLIASVQQKAIELAKRQ